MLKFRSWKLRVEENGLINWGFSSVLNKGAFAMKESEVTELTPEELQEQEKQAREKRFWERMLLLSAFLMMCSMASLAYVSGALHGPKGLVAEGVVKKTDDYTLCFIQEVDLSPNDVSAEIDNSMEITEDIWNTEFDGRMRITVCYLIFDAREAFSSHENGLTGMACATELPWGHFVQFTVGACETRTMVHEFTHVLCNMHGYDHPFAYSEGLARYAESDYGWYQEGWEYLQRLGPAQSLELPSEELIGSDYADAYKQGEATGWCQVFYLCQIKGMAPEDVLALPRAEYPDPQVAYDALLAFVRELQQR